MLKLLYAFFNLTLLCYSALSIISYGSAAASMFHMKSSTTGGKASKKSSVNDRGSRPFIFDIIATHDAAGKGYDDDSLDQYVHVSDTSFIDGFSTFANSTIGHSSDIYGLGIDNPSRHESMRESYTDSPSSSSSNDDTSSELAVQRARADAVISSAEIDAIVANAQKLSTLSSAEIQKLGWKVVFKTELFSLYKRRQAKEGGNGKGRPGPVEYLLSGEFADVTPRVFLQSQLDRDSRTRWDTTMKAMTSDTSLEVMLRGDDFSVDNLYFRTKWPWPMKDREYFLKRRCKLWRDQAFVLASRSYEPDAASADGGKGVKNGKKNDDVIRVDNYWSFATFFSTNNSTAAFSTATTASPPDSNHAASTNKLIMNKMAASSNWPYSHSFSQTNSNTWRVNSRSGGLYRGRISLLRERQKKRLGAPAQEEESSSGLVSADNDSSVGDLPGSVQQQPVILPVDLPSVRFVTIFCDDQKVPLPNYITDLLSKAGENVVPSSIDAILEDCRRISFQQKQK